MKKNNRTEEEYREAAKKSFSIAGMCRELGLGTYGANYRKIHKAIEKYNIDVSHFTGKSWNVGGIFNPMSGVKKELSEILVENSEYDNTSYLRMRLINENVKECKCERCGRTEWEGNPIPLQLHHINGERSDNRLENLQLLCPNCHALTDNYCGKNVYIKKITTDKEKIEKFKKIYGNRTIEDVFGKKIIFVKKNNSKKKCPICGKEIINKRSKYCSLNCAHKAQRKLPSDDIIMGYINNGKTNTEIAELCNVSEASIRNWKKNNLF